MKDYFNINKFSIRSLFVNLVCEKELTILVSLLNFKYQVVNLTDCVD